MKLDFITAYRVRRIGTDRFYGTNHGRDWWSRPAYAHRHCTTLNKRNPNTWEVVEYYCWEKK